MNIRKVGPNAVTIECLTCGQEVAHNYADCTLVGEFVLATPSCTTAGCTRAGTFISRQRPDEDAEAWKWDHNRAMNDVFAKAIRKGAKHGDSLTAGEKINITTEGAKAHGKRFSHEELKHFGASARVKSVDEEASGQ